MPPFTLSRSLVGLYGPERQRYIAASKHPRPSGLLCTFVQHFSIFHTLSRSRLLVHRPSIPQRRKLALAVAGQNESTRQDLRGALRKAFLSRLPGTRGPPLET